MVTLYRFPRGHWRPRQTTGGGVAVLAAKHGRGEATQEGSLPDRLVRKIFVCRRPQVPAYRLARAKVGRGGGPAISRRAAGQGQEWPTREGRSLICYIRVNGIALELPGSVARSAA